MNKDIFPILRAIDNKTNWDLLTQIIDSPKNTSEIDSILTIMPLNRRLNILKEAGLIDRIQIGKNAMKNQVTKLGLKVYNQIVGLDIK